MNVVVVWLASLVMACGLLRFGLFVRLWCGFGHEHKLWPQMQKHLYGSVLMMAVACGALLLAPATRAASSLTEPAPVSASRHVHVPIVNALYRRDVRKAATEVWGIDAPVARLAAQIHQESAWNPKAHSGVGAEGLAQFMPATGKWLAKKFPELGPYDPWDPTWSAHAAAIFDQYLVTRNGGDTPCATWAFALSAYNGGEGTLHQEQRLAASAGLDPGRWFGNTARYNARSNANWAQNRAYVRRILTVLEPAYIAAGWSGEAVCHAS